MGKVTGFLEIARHDRGYIKPEVRLKNWNEYVTPLPEKEGSEQAARCMDCRAGPPAAAAPSLSVAACKGAGGKQRGRGRVAR